MIIHVCVNPIQDEPFWDCSQMRREGGEGGKEQKLFLPKICHMYPTMMKFDTVIPYLKKTQNICELRDTPHEVCLHQDFFTENQLIFLYQEIQI